MPYPYATGKSALTCRKHHWRSHPSSELDEVHRFNRAQEDALLPSVEDSIRSPANRVTVALARAQAEVADRPAGEVPVHLRDRHYQGAAALGHGEGYEYPHEHERGWVDQQHRPDEVAGRLYYEPSSHGHEKEVARRMAARSTNEDEET